MPVSPKASIIIPCYNAADWVEQCVLSAINQDYDNYEVIAIDNESSDSTMKKLLDLQDQYPDTLTATSEKNIYPNCWDEARLKGFEMATGDYFFTLASDDFYDHNYVSNCMKYFNAAKDRILALQSPIKNVQADGTSVGYQAHQYKSMDELKDLLLTKCPVNSPTVVYNRKIFDNGDFTTKPETYGGAADYDLYCQLADKDIFIWPAHKYTGYNYRWHPQQATWNVHREGVNYDQMIQNFWKKKWQM